MTTAKPTDCVLFIDDDMARFIIAWGRLRGLDGNDKIDIKELNFSYSPHQIAEVLNISRGQINALVRKAVAVGILEMNGEVSDLAQKCVNGLIAKKVQEFK